MRGLHTFVTQKGTIPTMPVSGPNTAESSTPQESIGGDPYRPICEELHALLSRKRGYYGCLEHPLENALASEDHGVEAWRYQAIRIAEKIRRLRGPLSAIDIQRTLLDIAGHAVLGVACLREKSDG